MKLINYRLLKRFREAPKCEYCGKRCPQGCDPAHIYSRGAGRVDLACNLVSLCRICHTKSHTEGKPSREELLAIAAEREHTSPEAIEQLVYAVRAWTGTKVLTVEE